LKIAIVAHLFGFRDGQGRVNYEVAKAVLDAGHELTMVAHECADDLATHSRARFVKIQESSIPTQFMRNWSFAVRSARWLRKYRNSFDVIQANGFITLEPVDIVAAHFVHSSWHKHPSYPFRLPSTRPYVLYQNLFTWFNSRFEPSVYGRAKAVAAVSRRTGREVQALGVDPGKIHVIYNGVDAKAYCPGLADRTRFGLPQDVTIALFVGDIRTPRKNLDTVLRAMRHLPDLHLAVAGDTKGSPYLSMARELGVDTRISFLGKSSEVALLMRSVDLFLFPSRYEAHPLVLMEALASGLPVIASDGIAKGEDFADACLLIQNPNDAEALAKVVSELLGSPAMQKQLSIKARECALQMDWAVTRKKYLALYNEVVNMASDEVDSSGERSTRIQTQSKEVLKQ
jgi:glycosyltransferase involved in cell wall biosynthesis